MNISSYLQGHELIKREEIKPTVILISSALFLTLHRYFGSIEFAQSQTVINTFIHPVLFMFLSAFFLLGIIPLLMIRFSFRESPIDFGLRLGDWRFGLGAVAILFPLIALLMLYPSALTSEMRSFYPFDRSITSLSPALFWMELWRCLFYYTAWEFFFRGFMLFGLRRYFGGWMAICIQTIPQCLWHIGMPSGEIISSILGGILFGYMALRSGSIIWPLCLHCLIGIGMDVLILVT